MPQKLGYEQPGAATALVRTSRPEPPSQEPPLAALAPLLEGGMDALLGALGLRGDVFDPTSIPNAAGQAIGVGGPMLKSLGKPLSDLLDLILTTKWRGGLPQKLRFTNVGRGEKMQFRDPELTSSEPFTMVPAEADTLLDAGVLDVEQPPASAVKHMRRLLRTEFDAAVGDPRNPTMGVPRERKSPMRRTLDTEGARMKDSAYQRGGRK